MVQTTFKWKYVFFSSVILFNVFSNSSLTSDTVEGSVVPKLVEENDKVTVVKEAANASRDGLGRQHVRPGQTVQSYEIEITVNGDSFDGRVVIVIILSPDTREDKIVLHATDLFIKSVKVGVFAITNAIAADFYVDDGLLYITSPILASILIVVIEYSGQLANDGRGLHLGKYNKKNNYLSMNLHPSHASRVFPCVDELTEMPVISFKFNNLEYSSLVSNSLLEENSANQFRPLAGPPCLRGMIAHNFTHVNVVTHDVLIYGRPETLNGPSVPHTMIAIYLLYTFLNVWTNKEYTGIVQNQDKRLHIFGLPDVATDWNALSIIGIWEPYLFMDPSHEIKMQSVIFPKIAEAIAKQWFGYVIHPKNRRYEWVVSGLASYAGWEMMRKMRYFGTTELDINTLFVTDVIQESLLRDAYSSSKALEPAYDLFEEYVIRDHIGVNGILKYKAPALMRMMRTVLGDAETDFIQLAAQALLRSVALEWVTTLNFIDAVNSEWIGTNHTSVIDDDFDEYLNPWIQNNGYPLIRVTRVRGSGVLLTLERFGFSNKPFIPMKVPITYTTSIEKNFDSERIYPVEMFDQSHKLVFALGDEDWVLFNIQGQGYYRVLYELELWDIIIKALEEPETRKQIHPLNRATLIDDALNIARAGRTHYEYAFRLVVTMVHETEYAPWKAFVRNMDFLRKRLVAYVDDNEDLDQDIYLRMVGRTIHAFEDQIGFYPDVAIVEPVMQTLTRGLVMEHACRARYLPCIAAAVHWFYDPNNTGVVNPNIPHEIRPAVYCTMVKEGDAQVIKALEARLEIDSTHYERIVILESLACSQDEAFINGLLDRTIAANSPYLVEERVKIFIAVVESSYQNANLARAFMRMRTSEIRNMYGGPEKLEEVFFILADNMADPDQIEQFVTWVNGQNNNLDDSQNAAFRAVSQIQENLVWDARDKEYVYELIHESYAPKIALSVMNDK